MQNDHDGGVRPGFGDVSEALIQAALREHPLAWIACDGEPFLSAAPVMAFGPELEGHMPRAWPLAGRFQDGGEATFLFAGPNGYMSPSWLSDPNWAPTWNFVSVQIRARVRLRDDPVFLKAHLERLCVHMERGRSDWTPAAVGARLETLMSHIVAFTAEPIERRVRFKLGQDERDTVFGEQIAGLTNEPGAAPLRDWMLRLNGWREGAEG